MLRRLAFMALMIATSIGFAQTGKEQQIESMQLPMASRLEHLCDDSLGAIVKVVNLREGRYGTGFWVAKNIIATAAHVVRSSPEDEVLIITGDGRKFHPRIGYFDNSNDMAIMTVADEDASIVWLRLCASDKYRMGRQVFTLGYPDKSTSPVLSTGYIAGIADKPLSVFNSQLGTTETQSTSSVVVNCAVGPGNSGGPLIDAVTGEVVGIVFSKSAPMAEEVIGVLEQMKTSVVSEKFVTKDRKGTQVEMTANQALVSALDTLRSQVQTMYTKVVPSRFVLDFIKNMPNQR